MACVPSHAEPAVTAGPRYRPARLECTWSLARGGRRSTERLVATHGRVSLRFPGGDARRDPGDVLEAVAPEDRCRHRGAESGGAHRDDRLVARELIEPIRERPGRDVDGPGDVRRFVLVRLADVDDER